MSAFAQAVPQTTTQSKPTVHHAINLCGHGQGKCGVEMSFDGTHLTLNFDSGDSVDRVRFDEKTPLTYNVARLFARHYAPIADAILDRAVLDKSLLNEACVVLAIMYNDFPLEAEIKEHVKEFLIEQGALTPLS